MSPTIPSLQAEVRQWRETAEGLTAHSIYGRKVYQRAKAMAERLRELDPAHPSLAAWDAIKDDGRVVRMGQEVLNLGAA